MSELSQDARPPEEDTNDGSVSRRTFLRHAYEVAAISSFMGIVVGVPVIGYLTSPLRVAQQQGEWVTLGQAADFAAAPQPRVVQFTLTRQDGWIEVKKAGTCWVVPDGDNLTVFNGRCTHLGCAYSWQTEGEDANEFHCPCHDGIFNRAGQVIGGPPPRPLDTLETKVENGELWVFYQDFRLGVAEKRPL
jgi:menaquinol-cytochrome c reductase iron-sulfur subunit